MIDKYRVGAEDMSAVLQRRVLKLFQCSILALMTFLLVMVAARAESITLNPSHPDSYVVVRGDTLWDISGRFLREPWRWPEVWKINPQIENPHLIYPGDLISLVYNNGKPELRLSRGNRRGATIKLSPQIRSDDLERAIPVISSEAIAQFLTQTRLVGRAEMESAPYIVASADEHLITGAGDHIYVRGLNGELPGQQGEAASSAIEPAEPGSRHAIVRLGEPYHDPEFPGDSIKDANIIGYEGIFVGEATLEAHGDPATLLVNTAVREALIGDRLLPLDDQVLRQDYYPHAPATPLEARIISVVDGVTRIGQYEVVVLNRGAQSGVEAGHVFAAFQHGEIVRDSVSEVRGDEVQLPEERAGLVMVFRTFDQISYALVMQATGPLSVHDVVRNP